MLACAATAAAQAPPFVAPPAPGTQTVTRGFDLAHTFYSAEPAAKPPLAVAWTADFDGNVSSPLVADGRVFVSASNGDDRNGVNIVAFDAPTGRELWRTPIDAPYFSAYLGYAAGRLFAVDTNGKLHALDPATGRELWVSPAGSSDESYPIATAELVYVQGTGIVSAFDAATGAQRFQASLGDGDEGAPAVSGDRLYAIGNCRAGAFDRRNGSRIWLLDDHSCSGETVAMASLFGRQVGGGAYFLDAATGQRVAGRTAPQVAAGDVGVSVIEGGVEARDLASGAVRWTYKPPDATSVASGMLAAAGDTVLWRKDNILRALDRRTGALTWTGLLDRTHVTEPQVGGLDQDLAIGGGLVLVPTGRRLWALSDRAKDPPPTLDVRPARLEPLVYGSALHLEGTVTTTGIAASFTVGVQRDTWPFHRLSKPSPVAVDRDTPFAVDRRPARNTLYRISVEGTGVAKDVPVVVLPRYSTRRLDHSPGSRGRMRVSVTVPRGVRIAGRPVVLYVYRAAARRYDRLGAGRLHGRRGSYRSELAFHTVAHFAGGDFVTQCVRGLYRQGMSYGDRLDRRCGAQRVT